MTGSNRLLVGVVLLLACGATVLAVRSLRARGTGLRPIPGTPFTESESTGARADVSSTVELTRAELPALPPSPELLAHEASLEPPRDGYFAKKDEHGRVLEEGSYERGEKQGPWIYWAATGRKQLEGTYYHGRATGLWRSWYDGGQLRGECACEDGELDGTSTFWKSNGELDTERSGFYRRGERLRP